MEDFDTRDLIDSGIEFDPQNWQDWGLIVIAVLLIIWAYFYLDREDKEQPTHRYNRETGEVEEIED